MRLLEVCICVIVKHVQYVEVIIAFFLRRGTWSVFQCLGFTEKIARLWFGKGESVPRLTLYDQFRSAAKVSYTKFTRSRLAEMDRVGIPFPTILCCSLMPTS